MQVGIVKRQRSQSIVREDNVTAELGNNLDSVILPLSERGVTTRQQRFIQHIHLYESDSSGETADQSDLFHLLFCRSSFDELCETNQFVPPRMGI
jgi:hypothetical protein